MASDKSASDESVSDKSASDESVSDESVSDESVSGEHAYEAMSRPSVEELPVEAMLSKSMVKRVIWVAPPLIVIFGIMNGMAGAVAAGAGVAIVVGNFLLGGWILAKAASISLTLYHAAALFGFFLRLGLIALAVFLVVSVTDVDQTAMGVSAVVSFFLLLTLEAVSMMRGTESRSDG